MNVPVHRFRRRFPFRLVHLKAAALFVLFSIATAGVALAVAAWMEGWR